MRWSLVLVSHEAYVGRCSGAADVSTREGVCDGVMHQQGISYDVQFWVQSLVKTSVQGFTSIS